MTVPRFPSEAIVSDLGTIQVPTIAEQLACVERELGMRKRIYPRWIANGKLNQAAADLEMRRMEAVRDTLKRAQVELTDKVRADILQKVLSVKKSWKTF